MTPCIGSTWIDLIHGWVGGTSCGRAVDVVNRCSARTATGVAGASHERFTWFGPVGSHPLWAIHHGGADAVSGLAGLDHHLGLVGKTVRSGQAVLAMNQGQPFASALVIARYSASTEFGHIQNACVQQVGTAGLIGGVVSAGRHKFVEILADLVVARIHHGLVHLGQHALGILVLETAQGCALLWFAGGGIWVNLHNPAMSVRFVGVGIDIKARIGFVPGAARSGRYAITFLQVVGGHCCFRSKVTMEVLFSGNVGAPRCLASAAVTKCA